MRWGVGSTRTYSYPQDLKGRVFKLCEAIRRSQCLPAQFCTSLGFRVHTKSLPHIDDSGAVSDCRIVHSFCSFNKFYMKMASNSAGWSKPFISAYGAVRGRRREETIQIQLLTGWRLKTCGVSSLLKLYDVKNAFPSPTFESIRGTLDTCSDKFFADMMYQHATSHRCDLTACDGIVSLAPGSGFPQGSSEATDGFNGVYSGPLQQYFSETDEFNHLLVGIHPIDRSRVSCSSTVFVDDIATRLASGTPQHLLRLAVRSSEVLGRSLDSIGIVQDADKAESVPSFLGSGSRSILKDAASQPGRFAREARYLGPYLHWGFSTSLERDRRIAAALRAWHDFSPFWFKPVSMKFKMVVFRAVVLSTLISGLAAFPLTGTDYTYCP